MQDYQLLHLCIIFSFQWLCYQPLAMSSNSLNIINHCLKTDRYQRFLYPRCYLNRPAYTIQRLSKCSIQAWIIEVKRSTAKDTDTGVDSNPICQFPQPPPLGPRENIPLSYHRITPPPSVYSSFVPFLSHRHYVPFAGWLRVSIATRHRGQTRERRLPTHTPTPNRASRSMRAPTCLVLRTEWPILKKLSHERGGVEIFAPWNVVPLQTKNTVKHG